MKKSFHDDFLRLVEKRMTPRSIARSRDRVRREVFKIRLAELRRQRGIRQKQVHAFSQSSLSKLEARADMRISTLMDYLDASGMQLRIAATPRGNKRRGGSTVLVES